MSKINYKKTFLLGFGFFAISVTWIVYNSFVPLILDKYTTSKMLIGFIMTIDNYFALFIQPAVGMFSDNIDTKFGKRMPFIMVGMPLATLFIILLANYTNLVTLIIFLILMNLSMSVFRSPVISLMPDITHVEKRSMANSVINFMGGLGAVIATVAGPILWKSNNSYPFYLAAALMFLSFIVLFSFVKEKRDVLEYEKVEKEKVSYIQSLISVSKNKNVLFLLIAICAWFIGYNGIESFLTLYGHHYLSLPEADAAKLMRFISLSFLAFAIPAGIIGTKLGKKNTIKTGIIGMILSFAIIFSFKDVLIIKIFLVIGGVCWALININSYPFVTDMAPKGQVGTYTGLYYLFSSLAAIISPPLLGRLIDMIGYRYEFAFATIFFIIAFFFMMKIKPSTAESI